MRLWKTSLFRVYEHKYGVGVKISRIAHLFLLFCTESIVEEGQKKISIQISELEFL